jgi:hypothetical protein
MSPHQEEQLPPTELQDVIHCMMLSAARDNNAMDVLHRFVHDLRRKNSNKATPSPDLCSGSLTSPSSSSHDDAVDISLTSQDSSGASFPDVAPAILPIKARIRANRSNTGEVPLAVIVSEYTDGSSDHMDDISSELKVENSRTSNSESNNTTPSPDMCSGSLTSPSSSSHDDAVDISLTSQDSSGASFPDVAPAILPIKARIRANRSNTGEVPLAVIVSKYTDGSSDHREDISSELKVENSPTSKSEICYSSSMSPSSSISLTSSTSSYSLSSSSSSSSTTSSSLSFTKNTRTIIASKRKLRSGTNDLNEDIIASKTKKKSKDVFIKG